MECQKKIRISDLTPIARAWATFVSRNLLCSHLKSLTVRQATLVTAILKGEPVNVGRLLADDLWGAANCSSSSSYISHASLIHKLCERHFRVSRILACLLADDLWGTTNYSSPQATSTMVHASFISKLCEMVGVYPENNEERSFKKAQRCKIIEVKKVDCCIKFVDI
ncbi:hypothetical protein TSUD_256720 [Trifolium subterraneum]|uniref:Putative plant transposon protein domain-containing protein n=1 Tax=Trifolium subterraneum TaxID=3900 RepID=A0A2Z6M7B9_TRISU|nr:hypothetical protein TSUD_256720 [Trifolium subterraneum]